jgi:hypothetical protein
VDVTSDARSTNGVNLQDKNKQQRLIRNSISNVRGIAHIEATGPHDVVPLDPGPSAGAGAGSDELDYEEKHAAGAVIVPGGNDSGDEGGFTEVAGTEVDLQRQPGAEQANLASLRRNRKAASGVHPKQRGRPPGARNKAKAKPKPKATRASSKRPRASSSKA